LLGGGARGRGGGETRFRRVDGLHGVSHVGLDQLLLLLDLVVDACALRERATEVRLGGAVSERQRDVQADARRRVTLLKEVAQRLSVAADQVGRWRRRGRRYRYRRQARERRKIVDALDEHGACAAR